MKLRTTIHVPFQFDATHSLSVRPEPHAHRYEVVLSIEGRVDRVTGFVVDMGEVSRRFQPIVDVFNNTSLNDNATLLAGTPAAKAIASAPTCENMAAYFAEAAIPLVAATAQGVRLRGVAVRLLEDAADDANSPKEWGHASVEIEW